MSGPLDITAAAVVNSCWIRGSSGLAVRWDEAGADAATVQVSWKQLFGEVFKDFRRLDPWSRLVCLGVQAAAPGAVLDLETRRRTAIYGGTTAGCLVADLRFQSGLQPDAVFVPQVFPYTLPSTGLGEAAIRHDLKGPVVCLSLEPGCEQAVLEEAALALADGGCTAALVCLGDAVPPDQARATATEARTRLTVVLLQPPAASGARSLGSLSHLLEADDVHECVEQMLRDWAVDS